PVVDLAREHPELKDLGLSEQLEPHSEQRGQESGIREELAEARTGAGEDNQRSALTVSDCFVSFEVCHVKSASHSCGSTRSGYGRGAVDTRSARECLVFISRQGGGDHRGVARVGLAAVSRTGGRGGTAGALGPGRVGVAAGRG